MVITTGTVADCAKAGYLLDGIDADYLLADKGYVSNKHLGYSGKNGIVPLIPSDKAEKNSENTIIIYIN